MKNLDLFINYLRSYINDDYFVESAINLYNIFKNSSIISDDDIIDIIEEVKRRGVDDIENIIRDDYLLANYQEEVDNAIISKVEDVWGVSHDSYLVSKLYQNRYSMNLECIGIDDDFDEAESDIINSEVDGLSEVIKEVIEGVENIEDVKNAYKYIKENFELFYKAIGSPELKVYFNNAMLMGMSEGTLDEVIKAGKDFVEVLRY